MTQQPSTQSELTLRDAIVAAHEAVEAAEKERTRILALALQRGVSTREIAPLLGVGHSTVWRWAGGKRGADGSALDQPHPGLNFIGGAPR